MLDLGANLTAVNTGASIHSGSDIFVLGARSSLRARPRIISLTT